MQDIESNVDAGHNQNKYGQNFRCTHFDGFRQGLCGLLSSLSTSTSAIILSLDKALNFH